MISTSREADFAAKPQGNQDNNNNNTADHQHGKNPKTVVPSTTTSSWSKLKDPRIVRVSRAFGGKDRHSKVCTVRGLRDRRVRLSVPTAIQLYDLQEKLGLNQPSKVVDWLLNAAKDEIDELPPLQMPPGNFSLISHDAVQAAVLAQSSQKELRNVNKSVDWDDPLGLQRPNFWNPESMKSKEVEMERVEGSETRDDEEDGNDGNHHHQNVASTSNFFPRSNHDVAPYNPFYRLNSPMNFTLGSHGFSNHPPPNHQTDQDLHNLSVFQLQQPRSQSLMFPSGGMTAQPYFPAPNALDHHHHQYDTKQIKQFQMLGSNSENPFLPFQLSMAPSLLARSDHNGGGDHHQNHSSNNNNCE